MRYRQDKRNDEDFSKDIKNCTSIERKLMELYVANLNKQKRCNYYTFEDSGVDNSGDLIKEDKNVNTNADFILHNLAKNTSYKIEIKFSRKNVEKFHLKTGQLLSYIEQNCCIIMFMDIYGENRYTIVKPSDMKDIIDHCQSVYLWGKKQKQILTEDCRWYKVPNISQKIYP